MRLCDQFLSHLVTCDLRFSLELTVIAKEHWIWCQIVEEFNNSAFCDQMQLSAQNICKLTVLQFFFFWWNVKLKLLNKLSSRNASLQKFKIVSWPPGGDEVICSPPNSHWNFMILTLFDLMHFNWMKKKEKMTIMKMLKFCDYECWEFMKMKNEFYD